MLSEILRGFPKGSWAHWVASDEGHGAKETREFLDTCFLGLPAPKRSLVLAKIRNERDAANIDALIHEIVTNELLHRFKLTPDFDPTVGKLTPDIAVDIADQRFILDVFVTHSPCRTVTYHGDGTGKAYDKGERAKKIGDTITAKATKYAKTNLPLVLFVYLGDHFILSENDIEKALFGLTIGEIAPGERFQDTFAAREFGGVFLSNADDGSLPRHRNLSAVVACDWFDTLNGKRLRCLVLHHYSPDVPLPSGVFGPFQEVIWQPRGPTHWDPEMTGQANVVARFAAASQLEFGSYTPDAPW